MLPLTANAHMAVEGSKVFQGENLRFLYKLREGPSNESFGIQVARLAGLPIPIIERAWQLLETLEKKFPGTHMTEVPNQLSLFSSEPRQEDPKLKEKNQIINELQNANPDSMTPLQALTFLSSIQERVRDL